MFLCVYHILDHGNPLKQFYFFAGVKIMRKASYISSSFFSLKAISHSAVEQKCFYWFEETV